MILTLQLLLLLTLSVRSDGYDYVVTRDCITSSADVKDAEFIEIHHYNKDAFLRFNSTVGEFEGYTDFGVKQAKYLNSQPYVQQLRGELERYCKPNLKIDYSSILDRSVQPKITLRSEQEASGGHTALLMCSAYNFYPPAIDVYWLRDGKKMTSGTISTEEMADGDWYYQIHSHLEYTPQSGEKISCVVEHASSKEPIIHNWDPSLTESEKNKVAIGASGLVLGIILSAAGFIYYKKKSTGRILVPS